MPEHGGPEARTQASVGHVLPNREAHSVTVVVPAQRLDLDVLAYHVEAEPVDRLEVGAQCLVGGGGVQAVWPVALVEGAELEDGLAVP